MPASCTVLIAPAEQTSAISERLSLSGELLTFSPGDVLVALAEILERRPNLLVLERTFAGSSRGRALVERLSADPALTQMEVRVVSEQQPGPWPNARSAAGAPGSPIDPDGGVSQVMATETVPAPLDGRGTRRAPRVRVRTGLETTVDGATVSLVDLSVLGAQAISPTVLRPNQRVRLVLTDGQEIIRVAAIVAWAAFEMAKGYTEPVYRAGFEFQEGDQRKLDQFAKRNAE